jgi:hypothetical protein
MLEVSLMIVSVMVRVVRIHPPFRCRCDIIVPDCGSEGVGTLSSKIKARLVSKGRCTVDDICPVFVKYGWRSKWKPR